MANLDPEPAVNPAEADESPPDDDEAPMELAILASFMTQACWAASSRLVFAATFGKLTVTPTALVFHIDPKASLEIVDDAVEVANCPRALTASLEGMKINNLCGLCQAKTTTMCSRCNSVAICGKECFRKFWPRHRDKCRPCLSQRDIRILLSTGEGSTFNGALAVFLDTVLEAKALRVSHRGVPVVAAQACEVSVLSKRELVVVDGPDRARITHQEGCEDMECRKTEHERVHTMCVVTLENGQELGVDVTGPQFGLDQIVYGFPFTCEAIRWPVIRTFPATKLEQTPVIKRAIFSAQDLFNEMV